MKKHIITYRKGYKNVNCRITNVHRNLMATGYHLPSQLVGGCVV